MKKKEKFNNGNTLIDGVLSVIIITFFIGIFTALTYGMYISKVAIQRNAIATNYAVQILEKINVISYYDEKLATNDITYINEDIQDFGIMPLPGYDISVNIKKQNEMPGQTAKVDLIKIIDINVNYKLGKEDRNINIKGIKTKEM